MSTRETLIARLRADPQDEASWAVYRDWLIAEGDPSGALWEAELGARPTPPPSPDPEPRPSWFGALWRGRRAPPPPPPDAPSLLQVHAQAWLGRPVRVEGDVVIVREDLDEDAAPGVLFTFARGHIAKIRVETTWDGMRESWGEAWIPDLLRRVLTQPVGALVTEIELCATPWDEFDYAGLVEAVSACGPLAVRRYYAGDGDQVSWTHVPVSSSLWAAAPWLEQVTLEGSSIQLGVLDAPRLRTLVLRSGGLPREPLAALATAQVPALDHLELWFGDPEYGAECGIEDLRPLFARPLPSLRHVALVNCVFADAIAREVLDAVWLPQLQSLALGQGVLRDEGAQHLLDRADRLAHLKTLDLTHSYLGAGMVERLRAVFGDRLVAEDQQEPSTYRDQTFWYVAVGE